MEVYTNCNLYGFIIKIIYLQGGHDIFEKIKVSVVFALRVSAMVSKLLKSHALILIVTVSRNL